MRRSLGGPVLDRAVEWANHWFMLQRLSLVLLVTALDGCAAYGGPYAFEPHPADVTAALPGDTDAEPVRVLVSIVGVDGPAGNESQERPALKIRLRIENTSPFPVTFDPGSLVLFSGDLEKFPDPAVEPGGPVEVAPGGSTVVDARFHFPGDGTPQGTDMSGLNLRWTLVIDGQPVTSSASFIRQLPNLYYDYPRRGIGVGYHRYPG